MKSTRRTIKLLVLSAIVSVSTAAQAQDATRQEPAADPMAMIGDLESRLVQFENRMTTLNSDFEDLRRFVLPLGSIVLSERKCSTRYFEDITEQLSGRYIRSDRTVDGVLTTGGGDGSHSHTGGVHTHPVTGRTGPLGGGERRGRENRDAAHGSNTTTIHGTAEPTEHSHAGGTHDHLFVGMRLCKVVRIPRLASAQPE